MVQSLFDHKCSKPTKRKNGPFGIQFGTYFSNPLTGGKIVGFHGHSSWYLDSIRVYLMQRNPSNTFNTTQQMGLMRKTKATIMTLKMK
jgi:hypothetical protein